jgi:hypothetical protein
MSLHLERIEVSTSFRSAGGSSSMTRRMPVTQALRFRGGCRIQPSTRVRLPSYILGKRRQKPPVPFDRWETSVAMLDFGARFNDASALIA